jgi:hypothetical protein
LEPTANAGVDEPRSDKVVQLLFSRRSASIQLAMSGEPESVKHELRATEQRHPFS